MRSLHVPTVAVLLALVFVGSSRKNTADGAAASLAAIQAKLDAIEANLATLSTTAEAKLMSRFDAVNQCRTGGALGCTVPACGERFPSSSGYSCLSSGYGNATVTCGGSVCGNGLWRSMSESVVSIPPDSNFNSAEAEAFLCATKSLDASFATQAASGGLPGFQYVAERKSGAVRVFPGVPQERGQGYCGNYDARLRSWFVTAMSGSKDVVIVYDASGSMASPAGFEGISRMTAVKAAVLRLLSTLTLDDYVGVVKFSSSATSHTGSTMVRASPNALRNITKDVSNVGAGGGTRFKNAITKAFDILSESVSSNTIAGCAPLILFLTDGEANDNEEGIFDAIRAGQAKLGTQKAFIHTYSMGSGADDRLPKKMACQNKGIWNSIADGEDPMRKMSRYYQFLENSATSTKVRWSAPYVDALGAGLGITAARTLVDRSDTSVNNGGSVLGVAAADLVLSDLGLDSDSNEVLEGELIRRGQCVTPQVSECELELLRWDFSNHTCDVSGCSSATSQSAAEAAVSSPNINNLLCEPLDTATRATKTTVRTYAYNTRDLMCCSTTPVGGVSLTSVSTPTPATIAAASESGSSAGSAGGSSSGNSTATNATTTTTPVPSATSAASTCDGSSAGNYLGFTTGAGALCHDARKCAQILCSCNGGTSKIPDSIPSSPPTSIDETIDSLCTASSDMPTCATVETCQWEFNMCLAKAIADGEALKDTTTSACTTWAKSGAYSSLVKASEAKGSAVFDNLLVQDCEYLACQSALFFNPTCGTSLNLCNAGCAMLQPPDGKPRQDPGGGGTVLYGSGASSRTEDRQFVLFTLSVSVAAVLADYTLGEHF